MADSEVDCPAASPSPGPPDDTEWQGRYGSDFIANEISTYGNKLLHITNDAPYFRYSTTNSRFIHQPPTVCCRLKRIHQVQVGPPHVPFKCGDDIPMEGFFPSSVYHQNYPINKGIINQTNPNYEAHPNKTNWDDVQDFLKFDHTISKLIFYNDGRGCDVDSGSFRHPILIVIPNEMMENEQHLQIQNIITKTFNPPAVSLVSDCLSSFYAINEYNSLSSGIVIDIGSTITTVSIISNGVLLRYNKSYVTTISAVCDYFKYILLGHPYAHHRTNTEVNAFVNEALLRSFYVTGDFEQELLKQIENKSHSFWGDQLSVVFDYNVTLKNELFECCEILFNPKVILKDMNDFVFGKFDEEYSVFDDFYHKLRKCSVKYTWKALPDIQQRIRQKGYEMIGIVELLQNELNHCDLDATSSNELFSNILVCGGGSVCKGLKQRLHKELAKITTAESIDITMERNASFIGSKHIASSEAFASRWTLIKQ
eukprot:810053_1